MIGDVINVEQLDGESKNQNPSSSYCGSAVDVDVDMKDKMGE